jgi:acyl-CoA synthetase (NDP forming)
MLSDASDLSAFDLSAVFEPRRIALVGASERPGAMGEVFWRNLSSFPGEVVPVTPSAKEVFGHRAYGRLCDVEGEVDLAVVVVPAGAVAQVIADAGAKSVPAAIVVSGGCRLWCWRPRGRVGCGSWDPTASVCRTATCR